jgi:hypothetical protein
MSRYKMCIAIDGVRQSCRDADLIQLKGAPGKNMRKLNVNMVK